ncbi:MAG: valine--tRNA ligase, partial [Chitinophagaceae bacterium]
MIAWNKIYNPHEIENQLYNTWIDKQYFKSTPDKRKPYTIVIPPPNITGVLHMGHTLNTTIQDILIRRARMKGFNACWIPGSDHASIATEAKVVDMLKKEKNIDKKQLSRSEFIQYAFEWKNKYGSIIYEQIKKLGCSVDWERTTFTMDDHYYEAVIKIFLKLYDDKFLYRGARMINWDTIAQTALSDEEVEYKDVESIMYHLKYEVEDHSLPAILVATQRPETIMGDVAVCVNPNDERYKKYIGKKVLIPLLNKAIPIIMDEYVSIDFGTGALKITPAHDINDYEIGLKYNLPVINILNEDGTISKESPILVNVERFEARKQIITMLKEKNIIIKEEVNSTRMGYSQRTQAVVEPRISTQWFLRMDEFAKLALDAVKEGKVNLYPQEKFINTYKHWLKNIKNWCISRQLWWGQRIPAWYDKNNQIIVAKNEHEAYQKYALQQGKDISLLKQEEALHQDEDCLDTWFSSWIFPQESLHGISNPSNPDFTYYYPTTTLVTGQDIIFFWVARMIMSSMYFNQQVPFQDVYFTGMVRDKKGRKMSKS